MVKKLILFTVLLCNSVQLYPISFRNFSPSSFLKNAFRIPYTYIEARSASFGKFAKAGLITFFGYGYIKARAQDKRYLAERQLMMQHMQQEQNVYSKNISN